MSEPQIEYSVVIPTIGRASLAELVVAVDQTPRSRPNRDR